MCVLCGVVVLDKKDRGHFFCFHLTRTQGHGVFSLSRRVPFQGALTEKKGCGTLSGQVESKKGYSSLAALLLRGAASLSHRAKYITGCLLSSLFFFSTSSLLSLCCVVLIKESEVLYVVGSSTGAAWLWG